MKVVITQPVVFPKVHLLHRLAWCDVYVLMNEAQFNRKVGMSQLVVRDEEDARVIGIPVEKTGQRVSCKNKQIQFDESWWSGVKKKLAGWYQGSPNLQSKLDILEGLIAESNSVADLGSKSLELAASLWGLDVGKLREDSPNWRMDGDPTGWLLNICNQFGATAYMCGGAGSLDYLEFEKFENAGIDVVVQNWRPPSDGNLSWVHYWLSNKSDAVSGAL